MSNNEQALNTLKNIVGDDLFKIVCDRMAGIRLYIKPHTLYQSMVERNHQIREDRLSGADWCELAIKYGLSESRIKDIFYERGTV